MAYDIDESTVQKLKFRLLMARASKGDPLLDAEMLEELEELYKEKGIKMPDKIRLYIRSEYREISKELEEEIKKKSDEMSRLIKEKKQKDEL